MRRFNIQILDLEKNFRNFFIKFFTRKFYTLLPKIKYLNNNFKEIVTITFNLQNKKERKVKKNSNHNFFVFLFSKREKIVLLENVLNNIKIIKKCYSHRTIEQYFGKKAFSLCRVFSSYSTDDSTD